MDMLDWVRSATLAPSIHNSQPWRFRLRPDGVDVLADARRRLDVIDPDGRQLVISVGAAVLNLSLAMHHSGQTATVRLVPAADEPLLASLSAGGPAGADRATNELYSCIGRRHTNRQPFLPDPVPGTVVDAMAAAAAAEGAALRVVPAAARTELRRMVRAAEARLRHDGVFRAELAEWTQPRTVARPSAAASWRLAESMPMRDFGLLPPHAHLGPADDQPVVLVLGTGTDGIEDRLRAGMALQRAWLVATARGLAVAPMSQPLDIPALRDLVSGPGFRAQVVLLLGYAPPTAPTPRRPVAEVLIPASAGGQAGSVDFRDQ